MESPAIKKLIWVVYYSLSGMGKSFFGQHLQSQCKEANIHCPSVAFDDISGVLVKDMIRKNPGMTEDIAFESTYNHTLEIFTKRIKNEVNNLKPGNNIIILDFVRIDEFIKKLNETFKPGCSTKLVAIIPQTTFFRYPPNKVTPFSQSLIANVLLRILNRKNHPSLDSKVPAQSKICISLSYAKLFEGLKSLEEKKKDGVIDEFVPINFSPVEDRVKEGTIPLKFTELLRKTLSRMKPFSHDTSECAELAHYVTRPQFTEEMKSVIGFGDEKIQNKQIAKLFSIFNTM